MDFFSNPNSQMVRINRSQGSVQETQHLISNNLVVSFQCFVDLFRKSVPHHFGVIPTFLMIFDR
jgi:hypothetical protein